MPVRWMVLMFVFVVCSCKKPTEPPPPPPASSIELVAEDASCTETWLRVKLNGVAPPQTVQIKRDGETVLTVGLLSADSVLVDENLLPNRPYTYKAYRLFDSRPIDSSTQATVTTMDITSHNWVFDPPVLLGDGSSSVLYDVAIINDTLAYAVGAVYKRDSLGNWDPLPYNLVKWNGLQWHLKRVSVMFRGNIITPELYGIHTFSATDIWLAAGMAIHGNGTTWVGHDVRALTGYDTLSFTKCWGASSTDMYFVGLRGSLAHYNGSTWRRVESGTDIDIRDVWGSHNSRTNTLEIACIASYGAAVPQARKLIGIVNGTGVMLPDTGLPLNLSSIWFDAGKDYYLSGSGIFRKGTTMLHERPWVALHGGVTTFHTRAIRGIAVNDFFLSGAFGEVLHFNGVSFQSYRQSTMLSNGSYHAIAVRGDVAVAVGSDGALAIGRR